LSRDREVAAFLLLGDVMRFFCNNDNTWLNAIKPNIKHPQATTGLGKSCFYDRVLCREFREKFIFDYPKR